VNPHADDELGLDVRPGPHGAKVLVLDQGFAHDMSYQAVNPQGRNVELMQAPQS